MHLTSAALEADNNYDPNSRKNLRIVQGRAPHTGARP
jgi:hypothetical protein